MRTADRRRIAIVTLGILTAAAAFSTPLRATRPSFTPDWTFKGNALTGWKTVGARRDVSRDERSERGASGQIAGRVDHRRLTGKRIAARRERRNRVAIVAAAVRVDDVAALANQCGIQPVHVEWHRGHVGAALDLARTLSRQNDGRRCNSGSDENGAREQVGRNESGSNNHRRWARQAYQ